ncbi:MAG: ABC transporter permease subunit [Anaerolineales bacterium]|nr:ABC transporter permease subunit [Anaerolineales bacterium]MCB0018216.1 ABC transporter permease subunit [Anaerolineales bacterium]MCB0031814.1 ABC transporter permease subunit [Anaerolineales bacterium]MCB8961589.1 ABC transporter permease subunit [Ardenticatenales bacterium]
MAQATAKPPAKTPNPDSRGPLSRALSLIFDVRVIAVIMQILLIALLFSGASILARNFLNNADRLGDAQFICRDGSVAYRCAYDFMNNEAGFDISDAPLGYENTDPYWWALWNGIANTFRVGIISVIAMTVVGTLTGIARLSNNWLVNKIALAYVEITRNTPILIQLLLFYFTIVLGLPDIREAIQPLGLPIYLSNRGMSLPWPQFMTSASTWIAFIVLGIIQFQVTWMYLGRREERTGRSSNRILWGLAGFFLIAILGWIVSSNVADNEGVLVANRSRIGELDDIERIMLQRAGINHVDDFDELSQERLDELALQICVLRDSSSEANFTNKLRRENIPYEVSRLSSPARATADFVEGDCEMFVAPKSILAAELATLEDPGAHQIVSIPETPVVMAIPRFEGFNVLGGFSMTGEYFALFLGLTFFYAGGFAEVVRAGILSVSKGQSEAARALGLSEGQRLQLIVLPQALQVIIPPMISTYLSLMKDTSLGVALGFQEVYSVGQVLINQSGRAMQIMLVLMIVYLLISIFFSLILNWYNSRILIVER